MKNHLNNYSASVFTFLGLVNLSLFSCDTTQPQENVSLNEKEIIAAMAQKYKAFTDTVTHYAAVPRTYENGALKMASRQDWTRGFFPGSLWYLYKLTGDPSLMEDATEYSLALDDIADFKGTHDLGFMIYCSAGNGYPLTEDERLYDIMLRGANALKTRYHEKIKLIRSWDFGQDKGWQFPVIIDNMMNLEFLCWATKATGDSSYYQIAVDHAKTTLKNHFREDNSSFHVVDYDTTTYHPRWKGTHQGYNGQSAWSRGQAWGLYGYTMMYRETKQDEFLQQARKIAGYILNHENMPADLVPYYDYDDPKIPNVPKDVSAAAITASALIELDQYLPGNSYRQKAREILKNLGTKYVSRSPGHPFFLGHSVGSMPHNGEINVPLNYADYYFLEALLRLMNQKTDV